MIEKAEEARGEKKVLNMVDFIANESSWKLSENFLRNCKEMGKELIEEDMLFMQEQRLEEPCFDCNERCSRPLDHRRSGSLGQVSSIEESKRDRLRSTMFEKCKSHMLFCPSSSYIQEESQAKSKDCGSYFLIGEL